MDDTLQICALCHRTLSSENDNFDLVGRSSTKRSKTSTSSTPGSEQATSDARFGFDLNDDDLEMQDDEPVRATGRDTAKAKAKKDKAKGKRPSSSNMSEDTEGIATIAQQLTQWNAIAQSRVEMKKERQRERDMKILMSNVDHLEGIDLQLVLKEKARIRAKYGK